MQLHSLRAPRGANQKRKRVGRGEGSGLGKTSGSGNKGQLARTGKGKPRRGFEGGQLPMYRRMPKRGFTNKFAKVWFEVNIATLCDRFGDGAVVDMAALKTMGVLKGQHDGIRVLGTGDMTRKLVVHAAHFTASAREKIEAAGGQAILVDGAA